MHLARALLVLAQLPREEATVVVPQPIVGADFVRRGLVEVFLRVLERRAVRRLFPEPLGLGALAVPAQRFIFRTFRLDVEGFGVLGDPLEHGGIGLVGYVERDGGG